LKPLLLGLLALLSSFTPLSIDMYLPALPVIATDLGGTAGDIQLTLSAFLLAFVSARFSTARPAIASAAVR
jgi:DHA1 family bicyclomycin/chloramphenicol resistance-like MFS transporter